MKSEIKVNINNSGETFPEKKTLRLQSLLLIKAKHVQRIR